MKRNSSRQICPGVGREALAVEVTTRCNGACLHCFVRSCISESTTLPVDLVKEILIEGRDAGYRHLHITGGEPLLWEGLFETIDYGFDVGYETIFMNTNGTLITEDIGRRLGGYTGFSISVSLDGPEDLHDRIRGKGLHSRAMLGMENALNGGNHVTVFATATKSLLSILPYFVDDMYRKFPAIDCVLLIQLIGVTKEFALAEEFLEPEDFIRLVRMVALLNVGGLPIMVKKNPLANIVSRLERMPWIPPVPPLYREGCLIVMADRHICAVHSSRDSLGRYRPGMIRKLLVSNLYRTMVSPDEVSCPSCNYVRLCRENGVIRPSEGRRDLRGDEPYCRRVLDRIASAQPGLGGKPERKRKNMNIGARERVKPMGGFGEGESPFGT